MQSSKEEPLDYEALVTILSENLEVDAKPKPYLIKNGVKIIL